VRRLLPLAILFTAGCRESSSPAGPFSPDGGGAVAAPQASCAADKATARVGEAVLVRCTCTPGASGPAWSLSPRIGILSGEAGGSASFVVRAADLDPSFGDTTFTVSASYWSAGGAATAAAQLRVLGNTWLTVSDSAAVQAVASDGTAVGAPVPLPGLEGAPLAIASRSDGALLVAQRPGPGTPPVVIYSRSGAYLGAFQAADEGGAPLFSPEAPPAGLAQMRDGSVWVCGGRSPVIFEAGGRFRSRAAPAPDLTLGIAQLIDGRVAVTYRWAMGIGFYDESGRTLAKRALAATPPVSESYGSLGALAVGPDGKLLAAAAHLTPSGWAGTLLRLNADLTLDAELPATARVPRNVPYALTQLDGEIQAAPSPTAGETQPACPARFDAALGSGLGCLVSGTAYRGVVHLAAPTAPPAPEAAGALRRSIDGAGR
jgi:hypothetical protein